MQSSQRPLNAQVDPNKLLLELPDTSHWFQMQVANVSTQETAEMKIGIIWCFAIFNLTFGENNNENYHN